MPAASRSVLALILVALAAACAASGSTGFTGSGTARVTLDGATYDVRDVAITIEPGDAAWFRIEGQPADHRGEDCVPGLSGGLGLYGDLPATVRHANDLAGKRLRVDFSGDGDDANLCFVGMGGLAGAEDAWVTIDSVRGNRVWFSLRGTFKVYDENGEGPVVSASASGTAMLREES